MKYGEALISLIQGMKPAEIRHFKRFAPNDDREYLILFDSILELKGGNFNDLKKRLPGMKGIHAKTQYLYDLILMSLRNYYDGKDDRIKLDGIFSDVQILISRGEFSQAKFRLEKAKKLATRPYEFVRINTLERIVCRKLLAEGGAATIMNLQKDVEELLKQAGLESQILSYYELIYINHINNSDRIDPSLVQSACDFLENHVDQEKLSDFTKIYYHMIYVYKYQLEKKLGEEIKHLDFILKQTGSKTDMLTEYLVLYVKALMNYIRNLYLIKDFKELKKQIKGFDKLVDRYKHVSDVFTKILPRFLYWKQMFFLVKAKYSKAYKVGITLLPLLSNADKELKEKLLFHVQFNHASSCFLAAHKKKNTTKSQKIAYIKQAKDLLMEMAMEDENQEKLNNETIKLQIFLATCFIALSDLTLDRKELEFTRHSLANLIKKLHANRRKNKAAFENELEIAKALKSYTLNLRKSTLTRIKTPFLEEWLYELNAWI